MTSIAEEKDMLGPEQFGFRSKRSTLDAVFVLATLLQKAKAKGWHFAASFIDISKVHTSIFGYFWNVYTRLDKYNF